MLPRQEEGNSGLRTTLTRRLIDPVLDVAKAGFRWFTSVLFSEAEALTFHIASKIDDPRLVPEFTEAGLRRRKHPFEAAYFCSILTLRGTTPKKESEFHLLGPDDDCKLETERLIFDRFWVHARPIMLSVTAARTRVAGEDQERSLGNESNAQFSGKALELVA